ncbi:MAG: glycosyltransferase family 4 protein [Candidatus Acidiferrales bacterium]
MRICFVSHGSGRGGAEEVLLETIECLKEQNFDCRVLMPGDLGLGNDLRKLGVPFTSLPYWPWMGHKSIWARSQTAVRNILLSVPAVLELRKWNPDIIYSNTMTICFGAILATILRRPHVWHLHELGYEDHGLTFDFGPKLSYRVINSASACIAVSKLTADRFARHIDPAKLTVILQSVHRQSYRSDANAARTTSETVPPRAHKLRCIIVGRMSEGKRQDDAVGAIAELKQMGIDAELLIVGGSSSGYRERLEILVQKYKLEGRVLIMGSVLNPVPFVRSADVVLMCSRCEAFGRVTVEGMLAGKPLIAANSGANLELIQEGFNGLIYKVGDTKDLAAKIRYLYENPDLATRMGQNGKAWSEGIFTKQRFSKEIVPFLKSVVDRHHPSAPKPPAFPAHADDCSMNVLSETDHVR